MAANLIQRQAFAHDDAIYQGSSLPELRSALWENPYVSPWPGVGKFSWPEYEVTLRSVLRGILPGGPPYGFLDAAKRTIDSKADLRWGPDALGFRRLLHPNGICLLGKWIIDEDTEYTGYFSAGSEGQLVARYSTCCTQTKTEATRSLSLVGKLFPSKDREDSRRYVPAGFITQEDLGGSLSQSIADVELRNAPDTTFYRRGWGTPILVLTGLTFLIADREPAFRQLHEIAELGKTEDIETKSPRFMRLLIDALPTSVEPKSHDFRDEIMAQIYDANDREPKRRLVFHIEVADEGTTSGPLLLQRRKIQNWKRVGRLEFDSAVASYNGDFVIHFHHPAWRRNRNRSTTAIRQERRRTRW